MKSTYTTVMTTALSVGLIHATPVFASHFETLNEPYMLLVYLNLGIIVFLAIYIAISQENDRSVRPTVKHNQGKYNLNITHDQPAVQSYAVRAGQMVDAAFIEIPRLHNNWKKNVPIKAGVTPTAWQGKLTRSRLRQDDVDACWVKKRRESN